MKIQTINIALLGFGTVGAATYKNLQDESLGEKNGVRVRVSKILVRDITKYDESLVPSALLTTDINEILDDQEIQIVVELVGGIGPARQFVTESLKRGKSVVTANKALIAEKYHDLCLALKDVPGRFYFEAAVAGAIPVISAFQNSLMGNQVRRIDAILNGTCNYILTEMALRQEEFMVALESAQLKGYAEADPSFDIDGIDAAHKLTILASLAFGEWIDYRKIASVKGIRQVNSYDISMSDFLGYEIRLIACGVKMDKGLDLFVEPCLVKKGHPLAAVTGTYNAVLIQSFPAGKIMLYGHGAGGDPTSSAVIGDIFKAACDISEQGIKHVPSFERLAECQNYSTEGEHYRYYVRILALDKAGVLASIAGILGKAEISIETVNQWSTSETSGHVPVFITTHLASPKSVRDAIAKCREIEEVDANEIFYGRIIEE